MVSGRVSGITVVRLSQVGCSKTGAELAAMCTDPFAFVLHLAGVLNLSTDVHLHDLNFVGAWSILLPESTFSQCVQEIS